MNSTLTVQEASLDLFNLTATLRGISIAARGQTAQDAPIDIGQVQARVRLWPLLQRRVVIEDVAASEATIRLDIDRYHHVNLEELFQLLVDDGVALPSTWNASVHRFTVNQLTLHLSVEGQPLATTLHSMAFQGSMTLEPLHIRTEMLGGRGEVSYKLGSARLHYHLLQMTAGVDLVRDRLAVERLRAEAPELAITGRGHLAQGQVEAQFNGDVGLAKLSPLMAEVPPLGGSLAVRGRLAGALEAPELAVTAEGYHLTVGPDTVSDMGFQGVDLHGVVTLEEMLPAQVHLGMHSLDLGPIVAQFVGNGREELAGDVSGTVDLNGPLRSLPQWAGQITVERLRLQSNGIAFANPAPLHWRLEHGMLQFEAVQLQAKDAHLDIRGTVDLGQERLDIAVLGHSPLAIVGTRIPGLRFQQGMVDTHVNIRGLLSRPVLNGQVLLKDGAIYIAAIHENLSQFGGEIHFADQTIAILSLQGQLAGGGLEVSGEVRLRGLQFHEMSLATQLNRARLRYPAGFFAMLDADLVISGNSVQQLITGEVSLSRARYRQDFDLASLLRQFRQRALEPPPMAQERLQLDVRIALPDPLRVENRLAKLELLPDLHVRGSVNRPIVLGRVEIEQGTADVAGTRFSPISGNIDFLNPMRTKPFFSIAADTQKNGYQIHVIATGTPQYIDLQLTSEPPLAETDILALLTVGAIGQALTTGLSTVLPGRVSAFLTGRLAEEISRGVGGLVGVDRLDIEPVIGGAQRVGGPKVTVGKDVSKNLSVTYSTIVGSTQEDTVSMEYRLTDNISILGVRDERGDVGVDVKYSIRFE